MNTTLRIACTMLVLACAAPVFAAPSLPRQGSSDQDSFWLGAPRNSVWTGRVRQPDGKFQDTPLDPDMAARLRKELAEIQVSIDVQRKLEDARKQLDDLAIRATRRGYEGRKDVLVEIALARASLFRTLDRPDDRRDALTSVLVSARMRADNSKYELADATAADLKEAAVADADPRLAAKLAPATGSASTAQSGGQTKIDDIVKDALERADAGLAADLGQVAIPALENELAKNLDALPELHKDPLWHLIRISQPHAAEFVVAHFDRGGAIWRARILRAMKDLHVLVSAGTWIGINNSQWSETPPRLAYPEWRSVVERLLADPTTARDALEYLDLLVQFDALSPGVQHVVVQILDGKDAALAESTINALQQAPGRSSVVPVLEGALTSPFPAIRASAASLLLHDPGASKLLESGSSPDPVVRKQVAAALRCHGVEKAIYTISSGSSKSGTECPTLSKADRETLMQLVADDDADVRTEAATSIAQLTTPLDSKVYDAIAQDPDPRVRSTLLFAGTIPVSDRARIALALAADKDPRVLERFDDFVYQVLAPPPGPQSPPVPIEPFIPALTVRIANAAKPFDLQPRSETVGRLYQRVARTEGGMTVVAGWAVTTGKDLLSLVVYSLSQTITHDLPKWARRMKNLADARIVIDTPTWVALFQAAHKDPLTLDAESITRILVAIDADFSDEFLPIAKDKSRDLHVRLDALDVAANARNARIVPVLHELLSTGDWGASISDVDQQRIYSIAQTLPSGPASQELTAILADRSVPDLLGLAFAAGVANNVILDTPAADALLTRWFDVHSSFAWPIMMALRQVIMRPSDQRGDWITRALHDFRFYDKALELIGDSHDPHYFDLLRQCLSPDFRVQNFDRASLQSKALNALTRYFDDRAADLILEVAGSTSDAELRRQCFAALETIRKYQEEKGRWNDQRGSAEARTTAVHDLVALLDDANPAVRAQALRGLATLGAVQEMPRVVRMLKDADESVRKAANDALGVLNAPPKKD